MRQIVCIPFKLDFQNLIILKRNKHFEMLYPDNFNGFNLLKKSQKINNTNNASLVVKI